MHLTKNSHAFSCRCIQIVGNKNRKVETEIKPHVLVKQASDRRIIDPAGTSHVQKKANVFRQNRVTILSPHMSNLVIDGSTKPQILAEKRIFSAIFQIKSD